MKTNQLVRTGVIVVMALALVGCGRAKQDDVTAGSTTTTASSIVSTVPTSSTTTVVGATVTSAAVAGAAVTTAPVANTSTTLTESEIAKFEAQLQEIDNVLADLDTEFSQDS